MKKNFCFKRMKIYSIIEDTVCELDKQTGETTPVLSVSSSDCIKRIITCDFNYEDNCIYGVFESRTATQGHISFPLYRINVEENKVELCGYANSYGLEIYTHNGISVPAGHVHKHKSALPNYPH